MPFFVRSLAAALAFLAFTSLADAQSVRLRGAIESVNGDALVVQTRGGETDNVRLKPEAKIGAVLQAQLSDITPGRFIGVAAAPGPDGVLKALEVHIFPETMRGMGEGFRPFDLAPGSSMTNGNISAKVDTVDGPKLTVAYRGGEQTIIVDKATPIVLMAPGSTADLKPGAGVMVSATGKDSDGAYQAAYVVVGRDGVKPPM
ncbi:MAG TPA: DUF5666 domain-containing protein [Roseiarcus sp.]|nr:DUF5666 domain-containing protein [Roseiarcus sp.]